MPKKLILVLIGLFLLISLSSLSLTIFAQNAPSLPVLPQSQGLLTENDFGEPDITVDSTLDAVDANPGDGFCADPGGQCTLRAAIMESNAFPLTQTIYVPAGTYLLTIPGTDEDAAATGDLDITDMVLIIGAGQGETIIDGNGLDRVFHIAAYDGYALSDSYNDWPSLTHMTIQGGNAPYGGGVLVSHGTTAFLQLVTLRDNYANGQHPCGQSAGAAIYAEGEISFLYESIVTENQTPSTDISTSYGAVGGYIEAYFTSIVNNDTDWAIIEDRSSCRFYLDLGFLAGMLIADNAGGAIRLNRSIDMQDSTITQNAAGISFAITELQPEYYDVPYVSSMTLAENGLFGIQVEYPVEIQLGSSIVSGHTQDCDLSEALTIDPDYSLVGANKGYNLFSDSGCPISQSTHLFNTDPQLLPLADNGGPTLTRAVSDTSPAIGAEPDCVYNHDQRGYVQNNGICTIGAYEYNDGNVDFPPTVNDVYGVDFDVDYYPIDDIDLTKYLYVSVFDALYDPPGDTDPDDVTNPDNYLMVLSGTDSGYQTLACGGSVQTQAIPVPITKVIYGDPWPVNYADYQFFNRSLSLIRIEFDPQSVGSDAYALPEGDYQLYICDNLRNTRGVHLDGNEDNYSGGDYAYAFTNAGVPKPQVTQLDAYIGDSVSSSITLPQASSFDLSSSVDALELTFPIRMDGYTLLDSSNVRLVQAGSNGIVETATCDILSGDDSLASFTDITVGHYDGYNDEEFYSFAPFFKAQLELTQPLSANAYRLLLCDDILSWEHIPLDGDYDDVPGGDFLLDFVVDGFVPTLPTPVAPTLNDYSDVLVALNLPTVSDVPAGTVLQIGRLTGESSSIVGSVDVGTVTFVDSNLTCETAYRYRVRLYDANENQFSAWSDYLDIITANCVTSLQHTFGLYKEGQWLFYAVNGYQREDVRFQYGPTKPGWTALVGDWNGDGMPGIGLYKDGTFMLRDLSGGNVLDLSFDFGPDTGGVPIVGDWNRSGNDTVGVFANGTFYLRNSTTSGPADLSFDLGTASSQPLAGDWDGDGTDSVGYFENNTFYLATSGAAPSINSTFSFGPVGWSPIAGDWDGDFTDTIGLYNNGLWRLRNSNNAGPVDYGFSYGDLAGGWQPLAFDGDTSVLNRLFNATVPTPRVPVIPGPDIPIPIPITGQEISLSWVGQFYNSTDLSGGIVAYGAYVNGLSQNWEGGKPSDDSTTLTNVNPDNFSARFVADVNFSAGFYEVMVTADDGVRLAINGVSVIDHFDHIGFVTTSKTVNLSGPATIIVEYVEWTDLAQIEVHWFPVTYDNPTSTSVPTRTLPPPTATLDPPLPTSTNEPFSCDKISVVDLGYGANSVTLTMRNANAQPTVLTGSNLIWNDAIIKPDFPNIYLGYLHINETIYWSGTDSTSPTNTFGEGSFNSSANRDVGALTPGTWQAVFVNGPVFLQAYLNPWDFSGSTFYFDHPTEATDCEVPLTIDPEPEPTTSHTHSPTDASSTPSRTPNMTPPTTTNTPVPTHTPGPGYTPPTSTLTPTPSDTPAYTKTPTPWPTSTPLLNPVCPSLEFTCHQLFDCEEAYACYDSGNTDLDADNDGVPCEAELFCTPR